MNLRATALGLTLFALGAISVPGSLGGAAEGPRVVPADSQTFELGMTWPQFRKAIVLEDVALAPTEDRRDALVVTEVVEKGGLLRRNFKIGGIEPARMAEIVQLQKVQTPEGMVTEAFFHIGKIPKDATVYQIDLTYDGKPPLDNYGPPNLPAPPAVPGSMNWKLAGALVRYIPDTHTLQITSAADFGPVKSTVGGMTQEEDTVFQLTNKEREKAGLRPLKPQPQLVEAARGHSAEMIKLNYFEHQSPTPGRTHVWDRVALTGFRTDATGENLYRSDGYPLEAVPSGVVHSWMNSPGHRANILNAKYTRMGIGVAIKGHSIAITQVFSSEENH